MRLNLGDVSLADFSGIRDAVALDDLIYGEPIAVPTPGAVGMLAIGAMTALRRRRRNGRAQVDHVIKPSPASAFFSPVRAVAVQGWNRAAKEVLGF